MQSKRLLNTTRLLSLVSFSKGDCDAKQRVRRKFDQKLPQRLNRCQVGMGFFVTSHSDIFISDIVETLHQQVTLLVTLYIQTELRNFQW